jgi:penicillin-binding protein 1A
VKMEFLKTAWRRIEHLWATRRSLILASGIALLVLILFLAVIVTIYDTYRKDLPSLSQLHNIEPSLVTKIYAADSTVIKEFYTERRILTPLARIPPHMIDALLATEDRRFYHHWGANLLSMCRALWVSGRESG